MCVLDSPRGEYFPFHPPRCHRLRIQPLLQPTPSLPPPPPPQHSNPHHASHPLRLQPQPPHPTPKLTHTPPTAPNKSPSPSPSPTYQGNRDIAVWSSTAVPFPYPLSCSRFSNRTRRVLVNVN
ncbi:hypothetical protein ACSQ67_024077 [Phaseolus vulgaris]